MVVIAGLLIGGWLTRDIWRSWLLLWQRSHFVEPVEVATENVSEFLIHPGLFWQFSGKNAERLTRNEGSDEEQLQQVA